MIRSFDYLRLPLLSENPYFGETTTFALDLLMRLAQLLAVVKEIVVPHRHFFVLIIVRAFRGVEIDPFISSAHTNRISHDGFLIFPA